MFVPGASKRKKIAAIILGFLMLVIMLFATFYIAAEADHDCTGKACTTCACIQQCENTLRQLDNGATPGTIIVIPVFIMIVSAILFAFNSPQKTLVSKKVRLNI